MAKGTTAGSGWNLRVRVVPTDSPWNWLAAGWRDFVRVPRLSLAYGVTFSAVGYVLTYWLYASGALYLILPAAAGFALVGPAAAVGLYDISRRLESGRPITAGAVASAVTSRGDVFAAMGLVLMLFFLAWMEIALMIFAFFFSERSISAGSLVELVFFAPESLPFLVTGTLAGGVLAAAVFTVSTVSLPLLLDRDVNVPTAIATSLRAVKRNRKALALWALIIAVCMSIGIATLFLGLVLTLPLLGFATWHAYRDLVTFEAGDAVGNAVLGGTRHAV